MIQLLRRLFRDTAGLAVIETAIAAPALALLSVGGFQISQLVARQHELQSGADDAAAMALAGWTSTTGDQSALKGVIKQTLNLTDSQVTLALKYRCGTDTALQTSGTSCPSGAIITTYLSIVLTDTYTPLWSQLGLGQAVNFHVSRQVLVA